MKLRIAEIEQGKDPKPAYIIQCKSFFFGWWNGWEMATAISDGTFISKEHAEQAIRDFRDETTNPFNITRTWEV